MNVVDGVSAPAFVRVSVAVPGLGYFEYGRIHPMRDGIPNVFEAVACSMKRWQMEPGMRLEYVHPSEWPDNVRHVRFVVRSS